MMTMMIQKSRYCFSVAGLKFLQTRQKTAFCLLLFSICSAHASFVSRCSIDAIVLEDASSIRAYVNDENGHEYEKQSITVKVQIEKVSDLTTRACQDIKIGTPLNIFIEQVNQSTLKKGQKITFNRLYKTYENRTDLSIFYNILTPQTP